MFFLNRRDSLNLLQDIQIVSVYSEEVLWDDFEITEGGVNTAPKDAVRRLSWGKKSHGKTYLHSLVTIRDLLEIKELCSIGPRLSR